MPIQASALKIGIIGAGYAGTAFAAACHRQSSGLLEIFLFDKTGHFGKGEAYRTPFPFHLLNVQAQDISAFEDEPQHFAAWVQSHITTLMNAGFVKDRLSPKLTIDKQFLPRSWYGQYLKNLLQNMQTDTSKNIKLHLISDEVIDIRHHHQESLLVLKNKSPITVDKVILATGNNLPAAFPFSISPEVNCIANPWEYKAVTCIPKKEPVLIVGTGLSMIDAILTLYHQQHEGKIFAVSRHGLLPLPHAGPCPPFSLQKNELPFDARKLMQYLRMKIKSHKHDGGDWRSIINALRVHVPELWAKASCDDKKRFLRHLLPYWNIHRHRVPNKVAELLKQLMDAQQLNILSGHLLEVKNKQANIRLRQSNEVLQVKIEWIVNCMGPSLNMTSSEQPLLHALLKNGMAVLDPLNLGLMCDISGALKEADGTSNKVYALGSLRKGLLWESTAVPEIRKQCFQLAKHLMKEGRK